MNPHRTVLIVDADAAIREVLATFLAKMDCSPRKAGSAAEALPMLEAGEVSVVLLDLALPEMDGLALLSEIKRHSPATEVVLMTDRVSADSAIKAIRVGAYDYLPKPFPDLDEVWATVQRALEKSSLARRNRKLTLDLEARNLELSAAVKRLSSLIEAGRAMSGIDEIPELLDFFIGLVVSELSVDRASLMLLGESGEEMSIVASRGISNEVVRSVRVKVGEGIAGWVAQMGQPVVVKDAREDPRFKDHVIPYLYGSFISSPIVLSIPIKAMSRMLGVINVTRKVAGGPFTDDDMAFVYGLAGQVAVALERAKHLAELKSTCESLRTTQDQLVFSERLKALGQMASGVAHDFNNILAGIVGRSEILLARLDAGSLDPGALGGELRILQRLADQGAEAVRRIQDFTRIRKDLPSEAIDLNAIVRGSIDMTRPKWKNQCEARGIKIDIRQDFGQLPLTAGNANELTQVVSNLIFNAVEAMPGGGTLDFRTWEDQSSIFLKVSDTGKGMSDAVRARIFEPFFTTKETGQGMGLSVAYGIVARYGGAIEVGSEEGKGAGFTVSLPRIPPPANSARPASQGEAGEAPRARILVIEDDPLNRDLFGEILTGAGHEVTVAPGGADGVQMFRRGGFDIVITDLIMPGMSGWEVAREVKQAAPGTPVLLLSGWSVQQDDNQVKSSGVDRILSKPCSMEKLREAVRQMIAERAADKTT